MKRHKHVNIGTVSHGTMRPEDLIPSFLDELRYQKPLKREHAKLIRRIERDMTETTLDAYYETQGSVWDLESLFDALDSYCAPYFYFGAHQGDGSDYGYWLSPDFDEDFSLTPTLDTDKLSVTDLADVPKGYTGELLLTNDHGNLTLYNCNRGRKYQVWSIV